MEKEIICRHLQSTEEHHNRSVGSIRCTGSWHSEIPGKRVEVQRFVVGHLEIIQGYRDEENANIPTREVLPKEQSTVSTSSSKAING